MVLGLLVGGLAMLHLVRHSRINTKEFIALFLFTTLAAMLGAKLYLILFYVFKDLAFFLANPDQILKMGKGGGVFYGGVIAGLLFALWYMRRFKMDRWETFDIAAVGIPIGHAIARLGCFMGGCCFGRECSLPWAVQFPKLSHPVHPTQLYEAGLNIINFVILFILYRKRRFQGQTTALFFINYGIIRFVVEYFRGGPGRGYVFTGPSPFLSLSIPQLISLLLITCGLIVYRRKRAQSSETKKQDVANHG